MSLPSKPCDRSVPLFASQSAFVATGRKTFLEAGMSTERFVSFQRRRVTLTYLEHNHVVTFESHKDVRVTLQRWDPVLHHEALIR